MMIIMVKLIIVDINIRWFSSFSAIRLNKYLISITYNTILQIFSNNNIVTVNKLKVKITSIATANLMLNIKVSNS